MLRTNDNYLRWQLGRWARKGAPNVTMFAESAPEDLQLERGEHAIASIKLMSGDAPLVVTDRRLLQGGETLVRHANVVHCYWIDRDRKMAAKLKHSHFQRLIIEQTDRRELVLDGLGQAVFPLLKFFWSKLGRGEPAAE